MRYLLPLGLRGVGTGDESEEGVGSREEIFPLTTPFNQVLRVITYTRILREDEAD